MIHASVDGHLAWCGAILALLAASSAGPAFAADWPPALEAGGPGPLEGRAVDVYRHGPKPEWGYAKPQSDTFMVVHPALAVSGAPLYVVLHSAGHDISTALRDGFAKKEDGAYDHGLFHPPEECYGLFLDCAANKDQDWWWGQQTIAQAPEVHADKLTPTELRVIATIQWVAETYQIDPERIYLAGISMGGSGALGIGMRRGDLFAAMMVWVPAGTDHVARRMAFTPPATGKTAKLPDPPVIVDLSAPNDDWSKGQERLLAACAADRYPLIFGWGPFGHVGHEPTIAAQCDIALAFPWLRLKRNEAYPVFTSASCDQKPPWSDAAKGDARGQLNAFFRWKAITDTPRSLAMELRLVAPDEVKTSFTLPGEATADVTPRRLQRFRTPAGKACAWKLERDGKAVASGKATADADGLVTIPGLRISQVPGVLTLSR